MMYMLIDNKRECLSLQEYDGNVTVFHKHYRTGASQFIRLNKAEARRLGKALVKWADTGSFDNGG